MEPAAPPTPCGPPGRARPRLDQLFVGFATIALQGFGGVLPFARREIVDRRQWLEPAEFNDLLGLCQFLPGGNIVNMSVTVGARHRGFAGAAAAFLGLLLPPFCVVLGFAAIYARIGHDPVTAGALDSIGAGAVGLIAATGVRMLRALKGDALAYAVGSAVFAAVGLGRFPLLDVLLVAAPASIALRAALGR